jgi:hypothetical protein
MQRSIASAAGVRLPVCARAWLAILSAAGLVVLELIGSTHPGVSL